MERRVPAAATGGRAEPGLDSGADRSVLLDVEEVSKSYGGVQAVSNVSFRLRRGEILGIVGPNGAGKTSLVDVLAGVQTGDAGKVLINGTPASPGVASRARMSLSRTFQHPQVASELTVGENVALGYLRDRSPPGWVGMFLWFVRALVRGDRRKLQDPGEDSDCEAKQNVRDGLNRQARGKLDILLSEELRESQMLNVSYGTEKLAEIARALVSRPDIILMDEPFAGLDGGSIEIVCGILKQHASQGVGLVIVDHNLDILQGLCTRMIVLDQGEKIADDVPDIVLQDERVRVAYFGEAKRDGSGGRRRHE